MEKTAEQIATEQDRKRKQHLCRISGLYLAIKADWIDGYPEGYKHRYRLVKDLLGLALTLMSTLPDEDETIAYDMETLVDTLQGSKLFPNPNAG